MKSRSGLAARRRHVHVSQSHRLRIQRHLRAESTTSWRSRIFRKRRLFHSLRRRFERILHDHRHHRQDQIKLGTDRRPVRQFETLRRRGGCGRKSRRVPEVGGGGGVRLLRLSYPSNWSLWVTFDLQGSLQTVGG